MTRTPLPVYVAILACLSLAPLPAVAAEPATELEPIVVTGSWEPVTAADQPNRVVAVEEPGQADSALPGPAAALRTVPGIEVREAGGGGAVSVSIRGAEFGQVLGLFRGMPLNSPLAGGLDFGALPILPSDDATVEVLAGTASGSYGSDAVGGAVNVVPSPIDPEAGLEVGAALGTLGARSMTLSGSGRAAGLAWRAGAGFFAADGDRANSSAASGIVAAEAAYPLPSGATLSLDLRHLSRTSEVPGPEAFPSPNATQRDRKTWLTVSLDPAGDGLAAAVMGRVETMRYADPDFGTDSEHRFSDVTARLLLHGAAGDARLTGGAEATLVDSSSSDSGNHAEESGALFARASGRLGGPVRAIGSLRCDVTDSGEAELSPQAALMAELPAGLSAVASVARAFRAPTINERYWDGPGGKGNPDLTPESAVELEGSLRWRHPQASVSATAFRREVDDLISWTDEDGDWVWTPVNISSARITGVETDAVWAPAKEFSLRGGWSYLRPVDAGTGEPLVGRARHTVIAALAVAPTPATRLDLNARLSDHHRDADGTRRSYVVVGMSGARDIALAGFPATVTLSVDNLFDRDYQEVPGYPMPGRRITLGLEVSL